MKLKRIVIPTISLALIMTLGFGCATTQKEVVLPTVKEAKDWRFHDIVDIAFVKQHVKVPISEDVMLIDARPKRPKYDKGHIPMAVSIPNSKFDTMTDKLPKDKGTLLVFYCGGLK